VQKLAKEGEQIAKTTNYRPVAQCPIMGRIDSPPPTRAIAMSSDAIVEVHDLCKTYRDGLIRRQRIDALRGVSLRIGRGEIFGLLGPNGAGKTTLIKVLLGIVRKTSGEASLMGRAVGDRRSRMRVGFLPENHRFPQHHTGNSALRHFGRLSRMPSSMIAERAPRLLEMVGLAERGDSPVKNYSKGMQQRLGLAQAMMHDPELLVLDEPTDGVDPVGRKEMRVLLERLKQDGKTIFINSHLLQEVELVCDRVAILTDGVVRREGPIDHLTRASGAESMFEVRCEEDVVRAALGVKTILRVEPRGSELLAVTVSVEDQAAVDRCIDELRCAGVSIVSVSSARRTLEDAFLEVVSQPMSSPGPEAGNDP
jgi:ABC-2 type transport system ATP-binding protein